MPCHIENCQFKIPESQLNSHIKLFQETLPESLNYCIFHVPEDNKENWGEEKKKQFNKDIFDFIDRCLNNNEIMNLSNVIFPEIIDFSDQNFLKYQLYGGSIC